MTAPVLWAPSYRMIGALLPVLTIIEEIAAPGELDEVLEIEAVTNPRITAQVSIHLRRIPVHDRVVGPGSAFVMAAFAYPSESRFSDREDGAYYAARELETAVHEVSYHRTRLAERTPTPPMDFDFRVVVADIDAELDDFRRIPESDPVYDRESYTISQQRAKALRRAGSSGIVYRSVRRRDGECAAVFIPRFVRNARTHGFMGLRWDGSKISDVYQKASFDGTYPEGP